MKKRTSKLTLSPYLNRKGEVIDNKLRVEADGLELTLIKRGKFWSTRFMIDGKHANVNLRTTCERTAAKTAIDKAKAALQGRWGTVEAGQSLRPKFITIGEVIEDLSGLPGAASGWQHQSGKFPPPAPVH
jgi:hypothetical protein